MSCVFQNIDPPPPSPPGECVPSTFVAGGGHTRRVEMGVNILEDARHSSVLYLYRILFGQCLRYFFFRWPRWPFLPRRPRRRKQQTWARTSKSSAPSPTPPPPIPRTPSTRTRSSWTSRRWRRRRQQVGSSEPSAPAPSSSCWRCAALSSSLPPSFWAWACSPTAAAAGVHFLLRTLLRPATAFTASTTPGSKQMIVWPKVLQLDIAENHTVFELIHLLSSNRVS